MLLSPACQRRGHEEESVCPDPGPVRGTHQRHPDSLPQVHQRYYGKDLDVSIFLPSFSCIVLIVLHCKEILIYAFPENELRGLSHNIHIQVSVSDIFPQSVHLSSCNRISRRIMEIYKSLTETRM